MWLNLGGRLKGLLKITKGDLHLRFNAIDAASFGERLQESQIELAAKKGEFYGIPRKAIKKPPHNIWGTERARVLLTGIVGTEHDVLDLIAERAETYGTLTAVARRLGISDPFLGDIVHGRRPVSSQFAAKLGLKKVAVFVRE